MTWRPPAGGDEDDFLRLRDSFRRALRRRATFDDREFDDLYSQAWLAVLATRANGRVVGHLPSFLWAALLNAWKMEARWRHRHPADVLDDVLDVDTAPACDPGDVAARVSALQAIAGVRDPRRRRVLVLRVVGGWTPSEVQSAMGVSERTYRRLLTEGMHDVDRLLAAYENG